MNRPRITLDIADDTWLDGSYHCPRPPRRRPRCQVYHEWKLPLIEAHARRVAIEEPELQRQERESRG